MQTTAWAEEDQAFTDLTAFLQSITPDGPAPVVVYSEAGFAVVPHDQGGVIDPVAIVLEESASGTVVSWAVVPDAESYDVIRGELNNVVETGVVINLGTVVCIEANSTDESTLGWEDRELPEPGRVFFYAVEYYDGISSTYGTESAGKPRAPSAGDCQ